MILITIVFFLLSVGQEGHPFLFLTRDFVNEVRTAKSGQAPMFDVSLRKCISLADSAVALGTDVQFPKEATGEGTSALYDFYQEALKSCSTAWQMTGEKKYLEWTRNLLLSCSAIYPKLGWHPESHRSGEPGRLYYQMLDDCEFSVAAALAYDCVYDSLKEKERKAIENGFLLPAARFLMEGTPENPKNEFVFNRMHNHGTWAIAAVGFTGLVTGNKELVEKSLYGTDLSGEKGGLLRQIDQLYSPDGYYCEGAFYAGYALIPALLYAQCLDRVMPELDIFHRNGGALLKSASAMFSLSYAGHFFKMNDSCRRNFSMSDYLYAVDIIYGRDPSQKWLLDIARRWQSDVLLCRAGYRVAADIAAGEEEKFTLKSSIIRDGPDGSSGAVMVLRSSGAEDADVVTMKACGQGGYHGHFDRLGITYFAEGEEVLTDYGYARFPGLSLKNNGMYTPMNRSYAMTTVGHNTLVIDGRSQFEGVTPYALPHSPRILAFDGGGTEVQYMGALDSTAYPGIRFERWTALISLPSLEKPFVADVIIAESDSLHDFDLPFHHQGQMMRLSVPYQYSAGVMEPLGDGYGYQHLLVEAKAHGVDGMISYTWLQGTRFHTVSTAADSDTEVMLLRAGANDPDFILDRHPVFMVREKGKKKHVFASCIETHGHYDSSSESSSNVLSSCRGIEVSDISDGSVRVKFVFPEEETVVEIESLYEVRIYNQIK